MPTKILNSFKPRNERTKLFVPPSPTSAYRVKIARTDEDIRAAQALRYRVFNLELGEGLASSEASGLDIDEFDEVCDHLLIEHVNDSTIIGTYRLQTGEAAKSNIGYYSEQEFDFGPYESIRPEILELGRACIAKDHRNMVVLGLLWKGIAQYTKIHDSRYLIGCSSLTSTDPKEGLAAFKKLVRYRARPEMMTLPTSAYDCVFDGNDEELNLVCSSIQIPRLMRAYLTLGAKICAPPAMDREFKTIDFLTLLDLKSLGPRAMQKFLG